MILLFGSSADAEPILAEWIGPATGSWSDASSWSSNTEPNNTATEQYSVTIDNDDGQDSTVTLDPGVLGVFIDNLTIDAGDGLSVLGGSLTVNDTTSGGGTIITDGASSVNTLGLLEGVTHNGDGGLFNTGGTVRDVTNDAGILLVSGSTWDGLITNNGSLLFADSDGDSGAFDTATLAGTGTLSGTGTLAASDASSSLTITGDQTGDALQLVTLGGTITVNGTLGATNGSLLILASDVVGPGTIVTDGSSSVNTRVLLEGVTHDGAGLLGNLNGTVRDVTNNAGILLVSGSTLDGLITNNDTLMFGTGVGSFDAATLAGTGTLTGQGALVAIDASSSLTISGDQIGDALMLTTLGGTVHLDGTLGATNGSIVDLQSDVIGTGTIMTSGGSTVNTFGLLEGVTHNGDGSLLGNTGGTVRDVSHNGGFLLVDGSTWDGLITNNGSLLFADSDGDSGAFDTATLAGTGTLSGAGTLAASDGSSSLTITGHQTGDALQLVTLGGTIAVNGSLGATNGSLLTLGSDVVGTGTIVTDGSSSVNTLLLLEGVTHDGAGLLGNLGGTVRDVTNNAGTLLVSASTLDGLITNNDTLMFDTGVGSFDAATLAGTGTLTGQGALVAIDASSSLTISGDQIGDALMLTTLGGTVHLDGTLGATNGSIVDLQSDVIGNGTIVTNGGSTVNTFGLLEGVTHNGDGSLLANTGGTVRNVTNSSGLLFISDSVLSGHIKNAGTITETSADRRIDIDTDAILSLIDGAVEGDLYVDSGGVLTGSGSIVGDFTLAGDGIMQLGLAGSALSEYDQINVFDDPLTSFLSGTATLAGMIELFFLDSFVPVAGDAFDLITADTILDAGFVFGFGDMTALGGLGLSGDIITAGSRDIFRLSFFREAQAVPEPGTFLLLLIGLAVSRLFRSRTPSRS